MATTSLQDVALGIRGIGARTTFAGASAIDLSAEEDRFVNQIVEEGALTPAGAFGVAAGAAATMNAVVGTGTAKADYYTVQGSGSGQGRYIVRLEAATETLALDAADPTLARIDEVYIVVLDDVYDSGGKSLPVLAIRKGDAAASPSAPGADAAWDAYALLATIDVPAAAADILACTITDERLTAQLALDADTLDGLHAAAFSLDGHDHDSDYADINHEDSTWGHPVATTSFAGFMSASDKSKLNGISGGASGDMSAAEILAALKTVDGAGSGLDADTIDGAHSSSFASQSHSHTPVGMVRCYTTSDSAPHGSLHPINIQGEQRDDWGGHSVVSSTNVINDADAGYYLAEIQWTFASNATGVRQAQITHSSDGVVAIDRKEAISGETTIVKASAMVYMNGSSSVTFHVYQTSGSTLSAATGNSASWIALTKIA